MELTVACCSKGSLKNSTGYCYTCFYTSEPVDDLGTLYIQQIKETIQYTMTLYEILFTSTESIKKAPVVFMVITGDWLGCSAYVSRLSQVINS